MSEEPKKPDYISQEDWDSVDVPEWTEEDWANARPAIEVLPEIVEEYRRRTRGQQKEPTKEQVSIRLSPEVLEFFRATGSGWQSRIDDVLKEHLGKH
ncbi:BrnA antitoxin family protein [Endozoicomonas euniceicola]|uniref:BrnA antitoxin family protein n=1 Tax=Endozoicomonas euniceicola TaxID=1234143 RepID=A0ABY6GNI3_9GAMM|nr:BrnA antitoxin family protein [Endozoicomonas euniceicola]UYM13959.1 BrnA antitoxin family protein [Endozoicomonas euniceicola]